MHERTKSRREFAARKLSGLRCDYGATSRSRRTRAVLRARPSARAAQHLSPESSTCRPDNQSRPRLYLGSTTTRVAPHLNVRRATQVGWAHVTCPTVPVIRTRSAPRGSSISQAGPEREPGAGTKPGRSRSRGAWRMRLLVLFTITVQHGTYLTPASGPTYKVAPTHRALNTHRTHP